MLLLAASLYAWSYRKGQGGFAENCPDCFTLSDLRPFMPDLDLTPPTPNYSTPPSYPAPPEVTVWQSLAPDERLKNARDRLLPTLQQELAGLNTELGAPLFLRVFKESREMEVWLRIGDAWRLFRNHRIAAMSGNLGPKLKEGDLQAPEGFYAVRPSGLNPRSSYHLSFDIGYPNDLDRYHQRTGSFIMVHGNEKSLGCFAMTDRVIEEIYLLVEAALTAGQPDVPVHVFPFRMTQQRLASSSLHPSYHHWQGLYEGYHHFEQKREVPKIDTQDGNYVVK